MLDAAKYSTVETLRDARRIEIRAFKPDDRSEFLSAASRIGPLSLYRRFFTVKRGFSEKEREFFLNVDFVNHVALVAVVEEANHPVIIAGGRYVVERPGAAEVAFAIIDEYQGQGIGALLLRHLTTIARDAGLAQFTAEVLPDNISMLKVFEKSGLKVDTKREPMAVHVTLQLL